MRMLQCKCIKTINTLYTESRGALMFSIDYKNSDTNVIKDILDRACTRKIGDLEVETLDPCDFFIHL